VNVAALDHLRSVRWRRPEENQGERVIPASRGLALALPDRLAIAAFILARAVPQPTKRIA